MSRLDQQYAKDYLLGGRAFVTVLNTQPKDPKRSKFHFEVRRKVHKFTGELYDIWYVYHNKEYMGAITNQHQFIPAKDLLKGSIEEQDALVFGYIWRRIVHQVLPEFIHLFHEGKCGHCARPLTDPTSIMVGVGPECRKKLGIPTPKLNINEESIEQAVAANAAPHRVSTTGSAPLDQ